MSVRKKKLHRRWYWFWPNDSRYLILSTESNVYDSTEKKKEFQWKKPTLNNNKQHQQPTVRNCFLLSVFGVCWKISFVMCSVLCIGFGCTHCLIYSLIFSNYNKCVCVCFLSCFFLCFSILFCFILFCYFLFVCSVYFTPFT